MVAPPKITHWVRWDDPGLRIRRALCGLLVNIADHDNDPTCPACRAILAEREAMSP
jgi:hypothetical protein